MFCFSKSSSKVSDVSVYKNETVCLTCKKTKQILTLDCKHNYCVDCYNKSRYFCRECDRKKSWFCLARK